MSAAIQPAAPAATIPGHSEVKVYTHSDLLYWWPVWVIGLIMAAWTYLEDRHVVLVPVGAAVVTGQMVTPDGRPPVPLPVHLSASPVPGAVFALTLVAVVASGSGWVRGWPALTFVAVAAALALLVSTLDAWGGLLRWVGYLRVHINLGGYLVLSAVVGGLWAWRFFAVDRWAYVVFSPSQVRVLNRIGQEEQVYDTGGVAFEKQPYDWFRYLVGCGAGDIRLRGGGAGGHTIDLPNVPRVHRHLRQIESLLRTKDVEGVGTRPTSLPSPPKVKPEKLATCQKETKSCWNARSVGSGYTAGSPLPSGFCSYSWARCTPWSRAFLPISPRRCTSASASRS